MHYKLASLISSSPRKTGTTSEVYIFQPDANKENLAGRLFMLAEIESNKAIALKLINFLIDILNQNYYQNEKIILRERISTLKIEHIFETALAKTNKNLINFLKNEKIKIAPSALNITIGIIYENELHFSVTGKNKALLIYKEKEEEPKNPRRKTKEETTLEKYKLTEIGRSEYENKKPKEITKIFSDVISGHLPPKGYFLFSNEALPEYLTNNQLVEIITKLQPISAAEQIKKTLEKVNAYISFAGIIIKNTTGLPMTAVSHNEIKKEQKISADHSIDSLHRTEESTEKLLSPSGIIDLRKIGKASNKVFSKIQTNSEKANKKIFRLKEKVLVKKQNSPIFITKISTATKNSFINIANIFVWLFKTITNKKKIQEAGQKIKSSPELIREQSEKKVNWFKALNFKNRTLFLGAISIIILFVFSLGITNYLNNKKQQVENINSLVEQIEQKQNQIEAYLLYNNEEGAKKILEENTELINQLEQGDEEADYLDIKNKHGKQLEKIRHFVIIENPKEIANFSNLNSHAQTENITLAENKIYVGDSSQETIYSISLEDDLVTAIANLNTQISSLRYPVLDRTKNLYFLNNNNLVELNVENDEINQTTINLPGASQDIKAMSSYNGRLYLLDSASSQIYRLSRTNNGFTQRDNWLEEETNLSQSSSLAIDGNIYILNKNGNVLKFLLGESESLIMDSVEPKIESANKIIVSDQDRGYIYILESSQNRLIVFNKDGDFILQYRSDAWQNIKDFTVNEAEKKIYILNNNSVYEIIGTHFE